MPIIGEYHRKFSGAAQYSPTFSRGGNAALFAIEVFAVDVGATLDVAFEHKNVDDTTWTVLTSLLGLTSGVNPASVAGIKEQLRIAYTVNGAASTASVYANTLAPVWRPY